MSNSEFEKRVLPTCVRWAFGLVLIIALGAVVGVKVWPKIHPTRAAIAKRVAAIEAKQPDLKAVAAAAGGHLRILVFKNERLVEVQAPGWRQPRIYPMTGFSGRLGPKLQEGDGQIPEGVYQIAYLNPNSRYHLSMKVSYPNAADRARALADDRTNLGGDIMIHGKNVTVGCVPIGDAAIEELFYLVNRVGRTHVDVIIAPYDMREGRRPALETSSVPWYPDLCREIDLALATPAQLYRRFLAEPGLEALMDVALASTATKDKELLTLLADELKQEARVLFSAEGHDIDSHSVGVFLVEHLLSEVADASRGEKPDWCVIFSRSIPDEQEVHRNYQTPWREHLFAATPASRTWARKRLTKVLK